jgi:hypothetical protein
VTLDKILPDYQSLVVSSGTRSQSKTHASTLLFFSARSDSHLQILDPLPTLFKLHRPTIVAQEHDVEKGDLDQVSTELFGDAPLLADLV